MSQPMMIAADVVAILVLVFGLYVPRHRRRDMIAAFLGINAGVLGITSVLSSVSSSVGLGLGLFGILSIIRLRSSELDHQEIAYYFAALVIGLLGGIPLASDWLGLSAMVLMLGALWLGDHPGLLGDYRTQLLTLDRAILDESELRTYLASLLGAKIQRVTVRRTDLVYNTTVVEVRYTFAPLTARTNQSQDLPQSRTVGPSISTPGVS